MKNKIYIISMIIAALGLAVPAYLLGYAIYHVGIGGEDIKSIAVSFGIIGLPSGLLLLMAWLTRKMPASAIAILVGTILSSGISNFYYVKAIIHSEPHDRLMIFLFVLPSQLIGVVIFCALTACGEAIISARSGRQRMIIKL